VRRAFAATPLTGTYWKLTRLEGKPVPPREGPREPHLVFREEKRVTGSGGCNSLTGGYKVQGGEITFTEVAATRMACARAMDLESAFFAVLEKVRSLKIREQHLELYDANGEMVASFESRQFTALLRTR
jgi:heat shock protein HslJ